MVYGHWVLTLVSSGACVRRLGVAGGPTRDPTAGGTAGGTAGTTVDLPTATGAEPTSATHTVLG